MLFLALLAVATADTCLKDSICSLGGKTLDGCMEAAELTACHTAREQCANQLAGGRDPKLEYGVMGGGIVRYGESRNFVFFGKTFQQIHDKALETFGIEESYDLVFDYEFDVDDDRKAKLQHVVKNDIDLANALALASTKGMPLNLNAHKSTKGPTMAPTKPWPGKYSVHQVMAGINGVSSIADGADNRSPVGANDKSKRRANFKKISDDTLLRLHWADNIRTYNNGAVCYWELMVDGKRCPNEKWIRGGMHSQGNNNNDHQTSAVVGLCAGIKAGDHTWQVNVYGNGRDCYTGWDPESKGTFTMEVEEVKSGMYGYFGLTDRSKNRGEDNMKVITGRELEFEKLDDDSDMRLFYYDNFRVSGHGKQCTWWLEINGKDCKGGRITQSTHTHAGENDHTPQVIAGYCVGGDGGLQAGKHKYTVRLETVNSADCYTGWESSFHLEAREIANEDPVFNYYQRYGNNIDGRDNGFVTHRILKFTKKAAETHLRMFYSDNLRVYGHGKWCKWELRITNQACAGGMNVSGNRYVVSNQNNHFPHSILGWCKGIKAGDVEIKVHVRGNGADCYTGWDSRSNNNFVMEAREVHPDMIPTGPY